MTLGWAPTPTNLRVRIYDQQGATWQDVSDYVQRQSVSLEWSLDSCVTQGSFQLAMNVADDAFHLEAWQPIRIDDDRGDVNTPAAAPVLTRLAGGGSLSAQTYHVAYTYVYSNGSESTPSPHGTLAVSANDRINVATLLPLPANVASVKWYCSSNAAPTPIYFKQTGSGAGIVISTGAAVGAQPPTDAPYLRYLYGYLTRVESATDGGTKTYTLACTDGHVLLDRAEWVPSADTIINTAWQADDTMLADILQRYLPDSYAGGNLDLSGINRQYEQLGTLTIKAGTTLREAIVQLQQLCASVRPATAPVINTISGASTFASGFVFAAYTWTTPNGETVKSPISFLQVDATHSVQVHGQYAHLPPQITNVKWYFSDGNNSPTLRLVRTDSGDATFTLTAYAAGGAALPPDNNPASSVPRFLLNWSGDDNAHTDSWQHTAHWLTDDVIPIDGVYLTDDLTESVVPATYAAHYYGLHRVRDGAQVANRVTVIGQDPNNGTPPAATASDNVSIAYLGRVITAKPIIDTALPNVAACQARAEAELAKWSNVLENLSEIVCFVPYITRVPTRVKIKRTSESGINTYTTYTIARISLRFSGEGVPEWVLELGTAFPELGEMGLGWRGGAVQNLDYTPPSVPKWHNPEWPPVLSDYAGAVTPLLAGTYTVAYTWVYGDSTESPPSPSRTQTILATHAIAVQNVAAYIPPNVVSVNWYVSIAANNPTMRLYVNNDGTADFNILGEGFGALPPAFGQPDDVLVNAFVAESRTVTIQVAWLPVDDSDLAYYLCEWRIDSGPWQTSQHLPSNDFTMEGLPPTIPGGTTHTITVHVRSVDGHGNRSAYSPDLSVTTTTPLPSSPPRSLTEVDAFDPDVGNTLVTYTWLAPLTIIEPLALYQIDVTTGGRTYTHYVASTSLSFIDRVNPNNSFSTVVYAVDIHGQRSLASNTCTFTSADVYRPDAPHTLAIVRRGITNGKAWALISFTAGGTTHGAHDKYEVHITGGSVNYDQMFLDPDGTLAIWHLDGLTPDREYHVSARAASTPFWYGPYSSDPPVSETPLLLVVYSGGVPPPQAMDDPDTEGYPWSVTSGSGVLSVDTTTRWQGLASHKLTFAGGDSSDVTSVAAACYPGQTIKIGLNYKYAVSAVTLAGEMEYDDGSQTWVLSASTLTLPAPTASFASAPMEQQVIAPANAVQRRIKLTATCILAATFCFILTDASGVITAANVLPGAVIPSTWYVGSTTNAIPNGSFEIGNVRNDAPDGYTLTGTWEWLSDATGILVGDGLRAVRLGNAVVGTHTLTSGQWEFTGGTTNAVNYGLHVRLMTNKSAGGTVDYIRVYFYDASGAVLDYANVRNNANTADLAASVTSSWVAQDGFVPPAGTSGHPVPVDAVRAALKISFTTSATNQWLIVDRLEAEYANTTLATSALQIRKPDGVVVGALDAPNNYTQLEFTNHLVLADLTNSGSINETIGATAPGGASAGDRHYFTTLYCWGYYDGAHWITEQRYALDGWVYYIGASAGAEISAAGTTEYLYVALPSDRAVQANRLVYTLYVNGTNNISNYWTFVLRTFPGLVTLASITTSGLSGSTWSRAQASSFSAQPSTSDMGLEIIVTQTGSPGPLRFTPSLFVNDVLQ